MIRDGSRDSFDDNQHTHTYLPGCPHMSDGATRDLAEVLRGGDGLIGDVPDDPRLAGAWTKGDTWQQGVARMNARELRRKRVAKIEKARARQAKWMRWLKKSRAFVKNQKGKL